MEHNNFLQSKMDKEQAQNELLLHIEQLKMTSSRLIESERRLKKAQALAQVGNWEIDLANNTIWGSQEALRLYGLESENGIIPLDLVKNKVVEYYRSRMDRALMQLIKENIKYDMEFKIIRSNPEEELYLHSVAELECDEKGKPIRVLGVVQDITERKQNEFNLENNNEELSSLYEEITASEEELRQQLDEILSQKELVELSEERYKTLVNNSKDIIYSFDCNGIFLAVNDNLCEIVHMPASKIVGNKISKIISSTIINVELEKTIKKVVASGKTLKFENAYNENLIFEVTLSPLFNSGNKIIAITGTSHNISELKKNEQIIRRMAYYDDLTKLPNKLLFSDKLIDGIKNAKVNDTKMVILFIDLDNFKRVNDTLGHSAGDELLKEAAARLQSSIRECDIVARVSGDEFSVLIQNVDNVSNIIPIIERIMKVFDKPFCIGNSLINISSSIGASVYPTDANSLEDLLKCSDIAMYKAKELGKNGYQFFNVSMKNEFLRKLNIEVMLRNAIEQDELELHYQPQYNTKTRKIRGFEALIRWNSPKLGYLYPGEFISIAEETGIISTIGEWVLNNACVLGNKINTKYRSNLIVAVNISPIQLRQNKFYDIVIKAINTSGIKPECLELEVTENIFIENFDVAFEVLNNLRKYGIRIALDDFGVGYSSLNYLKKLPINLLKIDKSFISEIDELDPKNKITQSIISLVHNLNIETLAEGVEKEVQLEYLTNSNCDYLQGFYLSRPIPEVELEEIVKDNFS